MTAREQAEVLALAEYLEAEAQDIYRRLGIALTRSQALLAADGLRLLAQQPAPVSDLAEALEGLIRQWDGEYVAAAPNEQEVRFLREHADELREALRAVGHPVSVLQRDLDDAILRRSELKWKVTMSKSSPRWLTPEWQAEVEAADREVERARAALSAAEAPAGRDG